MPKCHTGQQMSHLMSLAHTSIFQAKSLIHPFRGVKSSTRFSLTKTEFSTNDLIWQEASQEEEILEDNSFIQHKWADVVFYLRQGNVLLIKTVCSKCQVCCKITKEHHVPHVILKCDCPSVIWSHIFFHTAKYIIANQDYIHSFKYFKMYKNTTHEGEQKTNTVQNEAMMLRLRLGTQSIIFLQLCYTAYNETSRFMHTSRKNKPDANLMMYMYTTILKGNIRASTKDSLPVPT